MGNASKWSLYVFFHCEGKKLNGKPKVGHHAGYSVGLLGSERGLHRRRRRKRGDGEEEEEKDDDEEEAEDEEEQGSTTLGSLQGEGRQRQQVATL